MSHHLNADDFLAESDLAYREYRIAKAHEAFLDMLATLIGEPWERKWKAEDEAAIRAAEEAIEMRRQLAAQGKVRG